MGPACGDQKRGVHARAGHRGRGRSAGGRPSHPGRGGSGSRRPRPSSRGDRAARSASGMSRLVFGLQAVREAVRATHGDRVERVLRRAGRRAQARRADPASPRARGSRWSRPRARVARPEGGRRSAPPGGRGAGPGSRALVGIADLPIGPTRSIVVALDGIMDPQNFGAVIRSAVALGATGILWPEHASAPLSPATFRASAGAIEHAVLCRVHALPEALQALAARGVTAVALDAQGDGDPARDRPARPRRDRDRRRGQGHPPPRPPRLPARRAPADGGPGRVAQRVRGRRDRPLRGPAAATDARLEPAARGAFPSRPGSSSPASVPVHLALALGTDLSPDEAYYLVAARYGARIPDHPPLTLWLLSASDRWTTAPVELRVRLWAVGLSLVTSIAVVALARARGAGREGCTLAAWAGSWALLPTAGGFVTTPDTFLLPAIAGALLLATPPEAGRRRRPHSPTPVGHRPTPVGRRLPAARSGGADHAGRRPGQGRGLADRGPPCPVQPAGGPGIAPGLALGPAPGAAVDRAEPLLPAPPCLRGAGPSGWSAGGAVWRPCWRAVGAQAALWSPLLLWRGLGAMRRAPSPDLTLVAGLSALVLGSALVRAVPPEPNWWAPAALAVIAAAAARCARLGHRRPAGDPVDGVAAHRGRRGAHPAPFPTAARSGRPHRPPPRVERGGSRAGRGGRRGLLRAGGGEVRLSGRVQRNHLLFRYDEPS